MAKRFTDTDKWKKPFIRGLNAQYKLLWFYMLDDCDHSGIWQVDEEVASIRVGFTIDFEDAKNIFKDHIQIIDGGSKWFIPDFIDFQYGTLNSDNRVHKSVLDIHKKYKIKPLISPLKGAMDKDKDKDLDKDKDKSDFEKTFDDFKTMRNKIKKPLTEAGEKLLLLNLEKLSGGNEQLKIDILNQSIVNCWQGVFELKSNLKPTTEPERDELGFIKKKSVMES